MNRQDFHADMVRLVAALIPDIRDDYRATDDLDDNEPGMCLTVGADADGWGYQTGDNSFTGGAYGFATWAVVYLSRDSSPASVAAEILHAIDDYDSYAAEDSPPIFEDSP